MGRLWIDHAGSRVAPAFTAANPYSTYYKNDYDPTEANPKPGCYGVGELREKAARYAKSTHGIDWCDFNHIVFLVATSAEWLKNPSGCVGFALGYGQWGSVTVPE